MSKVVVESLFRPLGSLLKHLLDKVLGITTTRPNLIFKILFYP